MAPDDIEARYYALADQQQVLNADLKDRALRLLKGAPRNAEALEFAGQFLTDQHPDPLDAARWNLALGINAIVYSNNRSDHLGQYLMQSRYIFADLQARIADGSAPAYSEAQLDAVFACPFVRALRLLDAACSVSENDPETCFTASGMSREAELTGDASLLRQTEARGACAAERGGSLDSLNFAEVDLGL